jgi:cyclic pyranopterin phosphate synthase
MTMVDITDKENVPRQAAARGSIALATKTLDAIKAKQIKKGDPLEAAKIAGMQAVKNTPSILPHCHQVNITGVDFDLEITNEGMTVTTTVKAIYKTGVEMDALTGTAVALLTVWDMVKYLEKDPDGQYPSTVIKDLRVIEKTKGED